MIAIDTNLLVFAHVASSPFNQAAYRLIADLAASGTPWAIPTHCLVEFFGIVTHPRIYKPATPPAGAIAQVEAWLASPSVSVLGDDAETWSMLRQLVDDSGVVGHAVHDARIAAVCIQHDVAELWTHDRDFRRFGRLRTRRPLGDPWPTRVGEGRGASYRVERRGRAPASR